MKPIAGPADVKVSRKTPRAALNAIRRKLERRHDAAVRHFETMKGTPNEIDTQGGFCNGLQEALCVIDAAIAALGKPVAS